MKLSGVHIRRVGTPITRNLEHILFEDAAPRKSKKGTSFFNICFLLSDPCKSDSALSVSYICGVIKGFQIKVNITTFSSNIL